MNRAGVAFPVNSNFLVITIIKIPLFVFVVCICLVSCITCVEQFSCNYNYMYKACVCGVYIIVSCVTCVVHLYVWNFVLNGLYWRYIHEQGFLLIRYTI